MFEQVKATDGHEEDPLALGLTKVAVFAKDVNLRVFEKVLEIVPEYYNSFTFRISPDLDRQADIDNDENNHYFGCYYIRLI